MSEFDLLTEEQKSKIKVLPLSRIKELLEGLSCYTVAEESGLSHPTIAKLRRGDESNYTFTTLLQISWYLNKTRRRK